MAESLRILSVNAHPHDFTHTAGTLGIHTSRGDTATVVSMTTGAHTHNEKLHDELMKPVEEQDPAIINETDEHRAAIKDKELRKACAIFGVTDVRVLGFPQPFRLNRYPEAADRLRDIILDVRPHVLITQSPYSHAYQGRAAGVAADDHIETALATLEARGEAGRPQPGAKPHKITTTLFPGVYFERTDHDFNVDISDWFEQRVEAEAVYVSQGHTEDFARRRMLLAVGYPGWFSGTLYAEGFVREQPELVPAIPMSELGLRKATESIEDRYQRMVGKAGKDF